MAYTKQTWANLPSKTTPISAQRLNHMEDGIYDAASKADDAYSGLSAKQPKTLDTAITVDGTQETTVEGALGAINTLAAGNKTAIGNIKDGTTIDSFADVESALSGILDGTTIDSFGDVETALSDKVDTSDLGANSGVATLDSSGKLNSSQIPSGMGADVEGNPSGSATAGNLTKLRINNDIYAIPQGGGGGITLNTLTYTGDGTTTSTIDFSNLSTPPQMIMSIDGLTDDGYTIHGLPFVYGANWMQAAYQTTSGTGFGYTNNQVSISSGVMHITGSTAANALNSEDYTYTVYYI